MTDFNELLRLKNSMSKGGKVDDGRLSERRRALLDHIRANPGTAFSYDDIRKVASELSISSPIEAAFELFDLGFLDRFKWFKTSGSRQVVYYFQVPKVAREFAKKLEVEVISSNPRVEKFSRATVGAD